MTAGLGFLWIADVKGRAILKVDPLSNKIVRTMPVELAQDPEGSFAVGSGSVWVLTNRGGTHSGTLTRMDANNGQVVADVPVQPQSHAGIYALGSIWVTSSETATVTRVDALSNTAISKINVAAMPRFLAASSDAIWVLSQGDGSVTRIDPSTNRVTATVQLMVPGEGGDLSVDKESVWVSAEQVPLSQIDPRRDKLIRQFVGGKKDDTLRVAFGSAWILSELDGQIWRVDLKALNRLPAIP